MFILFSFTAKYISLFKLHARTFVRDKKSKKNNRFVIMNELRFFLFFKL